MGPDPETRVGYDRLGVRETVNPFKTVPTLLGPIYLELVYNIFRSSKRVETAVIDSMYCFNTVIRGSHV